jgi:RNA-splicing ligase RtcB
MKNLKIFTNNIEEKAKNQIDLLLEQEAFKNCKVRIMPDVHAGAGCVIGFTADLGDKVIPEIVGVDIGCGMTWALLKNTNIDLVELDKYIRENIPSGMNVREKVLETDIDLTQLKCYNQLRNADNYLEKSLGTLGGGNHFIEIDKTKDDKLYLVVHSGSRNLGKQVCEIYQDKAIRHCSFIKEMQEERDEVIKTLKEQGKQNEISKALEEIRQKYKGKLKLPKDLCYIEGQDREDYLHDMRICQKWATQNRDNMVRIIADFLGGYLIKHETRHNYIGDDNIVRKGSISAYKDEMVLIPMNMRDGCLIAKGKGNEDWNNSAPHGAGRIMSRMEARNKLKLEDYKKSMANVFTTSVSNETIDEAPMVYKPMQEIIDCIKDTVEIIDIIKPIYNFKASE